MGRSFCEKNFCCLDFFLTLSACESQSPQALQPTSTKGPAPTVTLNELQIHILETLVAREKTLEVTTPDSTKRPTYDTRSDHEKQFDACINSGSGVRYVIERSGVTAVSLTLQNDTSGTSQGDYPVPYCQTFHRFTKGDFLYIAAQIIRPTTGAGSITCKIYDGTNIVAQAQASGFASIATCSGLK